MPDSTFYFFFYSALIIFFLGLIYKVSTWFTKTVGGSGKNFKPSDRVFYAINGLLGVTFSLKILQLMKAFVLDVLCQRRIFKEARVRWIAHMLIFYGFMLLLIMHALESVITEAIFYDYYSTRNPFFFLRDLFGAMVIIGVLLAILRRYLSKPRRLRTNRMDHYAIAIVALIMLSGIALEGMKIASYSEFVRMVEDYAGLDDEDEINALEAVWASEYGTVSPNVQAPFDEALLEAGREVHYYNCKDCHASAKWAFNGYAAAKIIKPVALWLDQMDAVTLLSYVHIIACFIGLAYLPFSKMFHLIATPLALMANPLMEPGTSLPANVMTRQVMELDACTHCGSCSLSCSAAMVYEALGNEYILPSEKMVFLKKWITGKKLKADQMQAIQEGVYLCTNCDRCTVRCPSGIRLKELWYSVREDLLAGGQPLAHILTPFSFARGVIVRHHLPDTEYTDPILRARQAVAGRFTDLMRPETVVALNSGNDDPLRSGVADDSYAACFSCQTCTTVCPVVGNYDNPERMLGLLPHQIMCCLGLGLVEMASGAGMIWDCLTCYKCQENCPQLVDVCDILYRLKNVATASLRNG